MAASGLLPSDFNCEAIFFDAADALDRVARDDEAAILFISELFGEYRK